MGGRTKLLGAFVGGLLAMAAIFGVIALADNGGGDDNDNVQNVSATPRGSTGSNSPDRNSSAPSEKAISGRKNSSAPLTIGTRSGHP